MNEKLLHFIWQFQYFGNGDLRTTTGEKLQIIHPGTPNQNQGPDFLEAKIRIGEILLAGNIELHLEPADWNRHQHHHDPNYRNVILHVVWKDQPGVDESHLPVFELQNRVSGLLLNQYNELMNSRDFIPCEKQIHRVKEITWTAWKERLLAERMIRKSKKITDMFFQNKHHWEETFWWLLARNFGFRVNADAFEEIAGTIPLTILAKHRGKVFQLEALLMGTSGLLQEKFTEDYPDSLFREFQFQRKKYNLNLIQRPIHFHRMRPGNFPGIRLSQLAVLVSESSHLFSRIREAEDVHEVGKWFAVKASDYWNCHYRFEEESGYKIKRIGQSMINNILINTICPVMFAFGHFHNDNQYKLKAIRWLEDIEPEKNSITRGFAKLGIAQHHAATTQALIELKNEYCSQKKCLSCAAGVSLIRN